MRIVAAVSLLLALVTADAAQAAPRARLKAFSSCQDLVSYARKGALRTDGGVGVTGRAWAPPVDAVVTPPIMPTPTRTTGGDIPPAAAPVAVSAPTADGVAGATPEFSGTNTQEADVDEPDIVKTDGKRIFAVTDRTLRVIDVASGTVTGTLALDGFSQTLLLRGNRLLVIATKGGAMPTDAPIAPTVAPVATTTIVTEVDVTGAPTVARTMEVPGHFVDARQNGATARLVIDAAPEPIIAPQDGTVDAKVAQAGLKHFMGQTVLRSKLSGRTFKRNLAPCDAVTHPRQFSGLDVLAILTIDLDRGMYSLDRDGVMAGAQVVYGSANSLYVASRRFSPAIETGQEIPAGTTTEIHRFDISDPEHTVYAATGTVPGFVLNNYALSEYQGKLRVATTEDPVWFEGGQVSDSQSTVSVLEQQGTQLAKIGSVSGLGKGQRIYAVRFMGERGYVVTFRQVDPLYTLDLSNPAAPRVAGALEIPGYSAYLHPVADGRLLGVGREGQAVQASLFDVSDPAAPKRLSQLVFGPGSSPVELDPHAFLFWAPASLAVVPFFSYSDNFNGGVGIHVAPNALTLAGRLQHTSPERGAVPIDRSFVIGDRVYTLSYLGVLSSSLADLSAVHYTAF